MWNFNCVFIVIISIASINCWKLPELPANKRAQYYLIQNDGGYKYGFDTGNGYFGKQIADSKNEVFGHYAYPVGEHLVDVRYTSGVNGFIPESYPNLNNEAVAHPATQSQWESTVAHTGQVQGEYSYTDETGKQHLYYSDGSSAEIPILPTTWSNEENSEHSGNSDGSYNFQYDAGDHSRQESSDPSGNVQGSYSYQNHAGHHDLTYVAGADTGFVVTGGSLALPASPEVLYAPVIKIPTWVEHPGISVAQHSSANSDGDHSRRGNHGSETSSSWSNFNIPAISTKNWGSYGNSAIPVSIPSTSEDHGTNNGDGSYSFEYDTGNHFRKESADKDGHVQGKYGYHDEAGKHDLSYKAGDHYGFIVTGGNLATTNIKTKHIHSLEKTTAAPFDVQTNTIIAGSMTLEGESETSSQINQDQVTELSTESGGSQFNIVVEDTATEEEATTTWKSVEKTENHDKSYSFEFDTGNHYRKESADKDGHVQGKYGYHDEAGHHDLTYNAGDGYGFIAAGGSLAVPNGLNTGSSAHPNEAAIKTKSNENHPTLSTEKSSDEGNDGSYNFEYDAGNHYRKEAADKDGHVIGQYGYKDEAGHHDLSYKAGDHYGFIVTGGNLAEPNTHKKVHSIHKSDKTLSGGIEINTITADSGTIPAESATAWDINQGNSDLTTTESSGTQWNTNAAASTIEDDYQEQEHTESIKSLDHDDASYSFEYDTGNHYRKESADKDGHVTGKYGYKDKAGNHDLSYKAGDDYGFIATGGSLAEPNGLNGKTIPVSSLKNNDGSEPSSEQPETDLSYSFNYNTGDHTRQESSDSSGNVKGSFSYQDEAGQHDLSYKSGPAGFVVTGGNLAEQNNNANSLSSVGDKSNSIPNNGYLPPFVSKSLATSSYTLGDVHVKQYFPSAENAKFGYVFESKH